MGGSASLVMAISTRLMHVEWQCWLTSSRLLRILSPQNRRSGNLLQWSSCNFFCVECGEPAEIAGCDFGIRISFCDSCLNDCSISIDKIADENFSLRLTHPIHLVVLKSVDLGTALRSVVDFDRRCVDKVRRKKWKKRLQKMLLRSGEKNF